jgi:hypothetical protein
MALCLRHLVFSGGAPMAQWRTLGVLMLDRSHQLARRADRERRYRARQRNGVTVVQVEVDARRLDKIARVRRLTDRQCADKRAIADAIAVMIDSIE